MDAWVVGATGLIGKALVERLLENPRVSRVTTLVRKPTWGKHAKLDERLVDFDRLEEELGEPRNAAPGATFFCCLGTTMAKAGSQAAFRRVDYDYPLAFGRAAAKRDAAAFLIVTAMGADRSSKIFYNRTKGEVEAALEALPLRRLRIFRPSLLLGERAELRPIERVGMALSAPLKAVMVGPLRKYRPIEGDVVARALIRCALNPGDEQVAIFASDRIEETAELFAKSG